MPRALLSLLLLYPALLIAAPVPPETEAARMRRIYGAAVDPNDDCKLDMVGDKLRIRIPSRPRGAIEYLTLTHAPRVCREVEGDFTASIRVAFPIRPNTDPDAAEKHTPIACGGLIAYVIGGDSVRVSREERIYDGGPRETFTASHMSGAGGRGAGHMGGPKGKTDAALVRLERRGQIVTLSYSRDGNEWQMLTTYEVNWDGRVKVGAIAENGYKAPFEAIFDQYSLTRPKK